ncbi:hypothetical protein DTO207G8_6084 [Paecilomyces variotii]|nr:hypothetical protein DTO207G8_6084 [Paecilomyces variotii]KAJ9261562.1 hypothetical protein DTO195F2_4092 [Paecilomyces variotii]KAJ9306086.1 hypothetical protein DTO217A2_4386 [Paecilomyces variotii]
MPCHRCTAVGRCHQKAIHQIPWALSNVKNLLQYDVNTRLYKTITKIQSGSITWLQSLDAPQIHMGAGQAVYCLV